MALCISPEGKLLEDSQILTLSEKTPDKASCKLSPLGREIYKAWQKKIADGDWAQPVLGKFYLIHFLGKPAGQGGYKEITAKKLALIWKTSFHLKDEVIWLFKEKRDG